MDFITGLILAIGIIAAWVIGFILPYRKGQDDEEIGEKTLYIYRGLGVACLIAAFLIAQWILSIG
ncbi:hypothetical protein CR194_04125 [Salipaludibacillus keqinensis]|uniref:Uncharacterized protein n=1 Tax=Salipaludibacillus keqinensis TaxID=2045207 RepID=A0A323TM47_9BACI|nr:hypothetical protein [Salipaludibacillus keqinensis]PYZ94727.1 hypothetical protein CR194_04125 [Salipaludibacillus keqinensis]